MATPSTDDDSDDDDDKDSEVHIPIDPSIDLIEIAVITLNQNK